ncbi:MAG: transketolase family protein [Nitrososphaerota archaeon]|nr:transketolase family protein [Nitrososphaerota archaeon]MDG7049049.1 transketolase family protein [Nitrososphaerota archaeon]MDG7052113.1 transketolase family protein [Nitrososphaerota archaeon]
MELQVSTRDSYGKALKEIGADSKIVVLDADLSSSTKTSVFAEAYRDRFINVGISEQNLFGIAAGLACSGKTVFASTFAVFVGKAWDILRIIAHDRLNVKVTVSHGGISNGPDGWSHHSIEDIAMMRALPNFTVVVPADSVEAESVVKVAAQNDGPWYIRLSKLEVPTINGIDYRFLPGKGNVLLDGSDVSIIACGAMVHAALGAAEILKGDGVRAMVINMASIKPIDVELVLRAARETGAVVTAEEGSVIGGLGGAVAEATSSYCPVTVERVGINDTFTQSGGRDLYGFYGLTAEGITEACRRVRKR